MTKDYTKYYIIGGILIAIGIVVIYLSESFKAFLKDPFGVGGKFDEFGKKIEEGAENLSAGFGEASAEVNKKVQDAWDSLSNKGTLTDAEILNIIKNYDNGIRAPAGLYNKTVVEKLREIMKAKGYDV